MSLFSSANTKIFDKLFEKATSPLLLEPDWESIVVLCDTVKAQNVTPKYVVQSIKKKFGHENAHVILSSLQCLEAMMKNCGGSVHKEVAQRDMIDALRELIKNGPDQIRDKVLELIQCWSHGLGQQHKVFTETYYALKAESYRFPPLKESETMFENNDVAPEWRDDKECFRCRQVFSTFVRKHHCRACGNIFCDKCSAKQCPIPKFGMDRDVRVCDACYEKLTSSPPFTSNTLSRPNSSPRPPLTTASASNEANKNTKTQAEIEEEESFQLALAISQSEAEEKERQKKLLTQKYAMSSFLSAPVNNNASNGPENNNEYAELTKYIEKGRQEQQQRENQPLTNGHNGYSTEIKTELPTEVKFVTDNEIDQFTNLINDHINNFKFRMLSNQQRSRNITTDTAVQSVFVMLQHSHPELHNYMQLLEEKRTYYENLQDKLNQLKDAREALNALRAEHQEKKQQEALERDRQRQIQLAQKLDFMRQKKQEYLEYQRQLHLQRLAQQELEMKNRLEQQRQLTLAREQSTQNPQLPMAPYDYSRLPQSNLVYQLPYTTLPVQQPIDSTNPYSTVPSFATQQQQQPLLPPNYSPIMMYSPKIDPNLLPHASIPVSMPSVSYPIVATNGDNNYNQNFGPVPMTNINLVNAQQQQQPIPVVNEQQPEPLLIAFD